MARTIKDLRWHLNRLITDRKRLNIRIKEEKEALETAEQQLKDAEKAQSFLQEAAQQTQKEAHKEVVKIVSKCLSAVFEDPYELRIEFNRKRGKTEAEFLYLRRGRKLSPRQTSGGVLDVAGLALRLVSLILSLPPARRFLALDEPWKGVSAANKPKVASLLRVLSKELGVQFLLITHDEEFEVGRVIKIEPQMPNAALQPSPGDRSDHTKGEASGE